MPYKRSFFDGYVRYRSTEIFRYRAFKVAKTPFPLCPPLVPFFPLNVPSSSLPLPFSFPLDVFLFSFPPFLPAPSYPSFLISFLNLLSLSYFYSFFSFLITLFFSLILSPFFFSPKEKKRV